MTDTAVVGLVSVFSECFVLSLMMCSESSSFESISLLCAPRLWYA